MKKTKFIFLALIFMTFVGQAQERKIKKAENNFDNYAYVPAINSYEKLVEDGFSEERIFKNLGNANYLNANYQEAAKWYGSLFALENATIDPEYMYRYAQTLKSLEKYTESDQWMQKFKSALANDQRAIKFGNKLDYLDKIESQSGRYTLKNLPINSNASDFAPSINDGMLVFSTARDSGLISKNIHQWNDKNFLNLYTAMENEEGEYTSATKLSKNLNKKTHESSTAFTKDGKTMYFTRNNSENGRFERDSEGVSRLKIYRATLIDGEWTDIVALPFNSDVYSVAHPALNHDDSKLYFASDMPGTLGQSDIFVVDINKDGSYSTPKNLGNTINTESRETFPYVTETDKLYFASDGHPGLGGLDIFATNLNNTIRPRVVNIGRPVNSEEDDFAFIINEETNKGFFSSNREGGKGDDDIYSFIESKPLDLKCYTLVSGMITDKETGDALTNVDIVIYDSNNKIVAESKTKADGTFNMKGNCESGDYKIVASKSDYNSGDKTFTVLEAQDTSDVDLALEKIRRIPINTELISYLNIDPIYFDFDKFNIRKDAEISLQKIISFLNEHPEVRVEVSSHTDSRAIDSYNLSLSQKRANATMDYLIQKGINPERLAHKGFGETKLTNECSNNVPCSKAKHQANRRSEFLVIE